MTCAQRSFGAMGTELGLHRRLHCWDQVAREQTRAPLSVELSAAVCDIHRGSRFHALSCATAKRRRHRCQLPTQRLAVHNIDDNY